MYLVITRDDMEFGDHDPSLTGRLKCIRDWIDRWQARNR